MRTARGWTQEELAERAGIHPVYLSGVETGVRNPTFRVLSRIASALGVPLVTLFEEHPARHHDADSGGV